MKTPTHPMNNPARSLGTFLSTGTTQGVYTKNYEFMLHYSLTSSGIVSLNTFNSPASFMNSMKQESFDVLLFLHFSI